MYLLGAVVVLCVWQCRRFLALWCVLAAQAASVAKWLQASRRNRLAAGIAVVAVLGLWQRVPSFAALTGTCCIPTSMDCVESGGEYSLVFYGTGPGFPITVSCVGGTDWYSATDCDKGVIGAWLQAMGYTGSPCYPCDALWTELQAAANWSNFLECKYPGECGGCAFEGMDEHNYCNGDCTCPLTGNPEADNWVHAECEPTDCDEHEGDSDHDGCCADVDIDDNDEERCEECDGHGGDVDNDGCCADHDVDDDDEERCQDCADYGGDEDGDGCCAMSDRDDEDPDAGCECTRLGGDRDMDGCCDDDDVDRHDPNVCECSDGGLGGDRDNDGCCDKYDCAPDDTTKGCTVPCCSCDKEIDAKRDELTLAMARLWPPLRGMQAAGSVYEWDIPVPRADGVAGETIHLSMDPHDWPTLMGLRDFGVGLMQVGRLLLLLYATIGVALAVVSDLANF